MSRVHLIHPSGDREQDARRLELLSWQHYQRQARVLANTPINAASDARKRVEAAKADFAQAWRALDGATR